MMSHPTIKRDSPYSMRLDAELRAVLEELAAAENRKLGNMINTLLREAIAARKKKAK